MGLKNQKKILTELSGLYKATLKWYWRVIALTVAAASVVGATFQVLNFCIR